MAVEGYLSAPGNTIVWRNGVWTGDPEGDLILEFEGYT
jgi:hypothetical protein